MKIYVSGSIYGGTQKIDTYKVLISNDNGETYSSPLTVTNNGDNKEIVLTNEQISSISGKEKIKIAEGTQSHEIIKLKGKGLPFLRSSSRGDQYIKIIVEVPKNLNAKQKEILKQFGENTNEKNYNKNTSWWEKLKKNLDW